MNLRRHTGVAVRSMVRAYISAIAFVMFTLLVIALTIDLGNMLENVRARAAAENEPLWRVLIPYMSFRAVDIITRLLGMACLAGALVATLLRHQRLEDVVLSAAGAPPTLTLSALLIVGVIIGAVQFSFQNWLRPLAVATQTEMQLGRYGKRFGQTELGERWFVSDTTALRAAVTRGHSAALTDIQLFEGINTGQLDRIILAHRAEETETRGVWRLTNATIWGGTGGNLTRTEDEIDVALPLNRDRVQWYGVQGHYLPNSAARQIAQLDGIHAARDAATVLAARKMSFFLPGIFALLGVSLARTGTRGRRLAPFRLLAFGAMGYVVLVSVKVFWALGMHGSLPPTLAATIPIAAALIFAVLLQLRQAGYLRRAHRSAR